MKKIVIILVATVVLSLMAFMFVSCSRATTQGQLSNFLVDHAEENFVYSVTNELTGETGTYTVNVKKYPNGSAISCPDVIENVSSGVLVNSTLLMGTVEYKTGCYFNIVSGTSLMTPAYTYRIQKENGNETFRMTGNYSGANFHYSKTVAGETSDGSIKLSGTYFDNNEFHQSLRTVTTFSTNFSFSFAIPLVSATENASVSLTAACSKSAFVKTEYTNGIEAYQENGVECYNVRVSRSTKVAGLDQSLYYAKEPMKASNSNFTMTNVLVKFYEPITNESGTYYVVYALKSAEIH